MVTRTERETKPPAARRRLPAAVTFTVLRTLCFLVPLLVCFALNINVLIATPIALLVAAILSNLLLRRWRTALALDLDRLRRGERRSSEAALDEDAEDAVLDQPTGRSAKNTAASPNP